MNTFFGLMIALVLFGKTNAYGGQDAPPFKTIVCKGNNVSVSVEINNYRQTSGAGLATIKSGNLFWVGGWSWETAEEGTRVPGYNQLFIHANSQNGHGPISISTLYGQNFLLSGSWLEMDGKGGEPVDCKIVLSPSQKQCTVPPQNDCSRHSTRLCCECVDGNLSCS